MAPKRWIHVASSSLLLSFSAIVAPAFGADGRIDRITILYDAFGKSSAMEKDWGYSVLVEYAGKRILFDTGDDPEILAKNATAARVDLSRLDFVVLSHRHGDHMGGMNYLLRVNPNVKIYAPKENFGVYGSSLPGSFYRRDESLAREQRYYKLFNMDGKLYYTFSPSPNVRFFALESTYPVPEQFEWLENELKSSGSAWKIVFFHHPLYSSGDRHGSDLRLRDVLEPLLIKYNVSVVLTGHDHFYERVKPQKGITYFVTGSGGQLRKGNIDQRSGITAQGFDTDLVFLAAEIAGDEMYFQAIARDGRTVDSGVVKRRTDAR